MRIALIILSILILFSPVFARQDCTLSEPPTLLNLSLGMTVGEVNSVIGKDLKVKAKPEGEQTFLKNYVKKRAKGTMSGVRSIFLSFYEGRLYQIELFYRDDHLWQDLDSLLRGYSDSVAFPYDFWEVKNGYAKARCDGFSLEADYVLNPHIQLTDDVVIEAVKEFRKNN